MSESTIQRGTEIQGLATAILLPTTGLFADSGGRGMTDVGPLTSVAGLSLFQRTVLTLQRAGIRQLIVLAGSEEELLKQTLTRGPRVTIPVRWMPIREFPLDDPRTWEALAVEIKGFCLIAGVQAVFPKELIEHLRQSVQDGHALVVTRQGGQAEPTKGRRNPAVELHHDRLISFHNQTGYETSQIAADLVVLPASFMTVAPSVPGIRSSAALEVTGMLPIRRWLERVAIEGRVRVISAVAGNHYWYREVWDEGGVKQAERRLLQSLKGEFEGFVDRYFNRKLSGLFTKGFLALGLSPNAITAIATMIGLSAAAGFAWGAYQAGIIAALLFQLAAVIDCCDGEVARLTFTESSFGAWLDIAADNLVHIAIFGGIALGAYARSAGIDGAWIPLSLGTVAVVGNGLGFWLVNKAQQIRAARGWKTPFHAAWSDFMLKNVASRDFSVIVLLFAVVDKLEWFLWLTAIGSTVFWLVMLWVLRPSARMHS